MSTRIAAAPGSLKKKAILAEYPDLQDFIRYVYDPFKKFHITSKNAKKLKDVKAFGGAFNSLDGPDVSTVQFFNVLDLLVTGDLSGHSAIATVKRIIEILPEHEDIIYRIIDKDLEIRLGDTEINKVFEDLIPTFDVALAESYEPEKDVLEDGKWFISTKLDGCRCIMVVTPDDIKFYSREGNEFLTLGKIKEEYRSMHMISNNCVYDGEICIVDKDGRENFKSIMKEIKKKDHTIENPMFLVFDQLSHEEFNDKTSDRPLRDRLKQMRQNLCQDHPPLKHMKPLDQIGYNLKTMARMQMEAKENGWEGLILRKDAGYKGKRSRDLLKVKEFFDAEYKVLDTEVGPFRINTPEGEKTIETMTAVIIEHKGCKVSVGSGFTLDERYEFYKDPNKIVGKIATIQYFEETSNDKGGVSLRFPTFKYLHGDVRNT